MSHVFLINPHNPDFVFTKERHIPLGVLYLSSSLKQSGHTCSLIDVANDQITSKEKGELNIEQYYRKKISPSVRDSHPDLIGVSVHFSGRFAPAIEIIRLLKEDFPDMPTVIGGIHPTVFSEKILLEYECIDFILRGESEETIVELASAIDSEAKSFEKIDGLGYRHDGKIKINKKEHFIADINTIPFPDYDLIDIRDYYFDTSQWVNPKKLPINLSVYIVSSRSCPRQCTFCSMYIVHGPRCRMRSSSNVVDEIEYLYNKIGQRYFSFMDDNFTFSKKRTLEICDEITKRGLDIQFDTPNGLEINSLNKEVLESLIKAGMVKTCLAIESGSPKIRKSINKRLSQEKIYEVFKLLERYPDLSYNVFLIIGFPNETHETLKETHRLIKQLKLKRAILSFATPFPGTALYQESVENKLLDIDISNLHNRNSFYYANETPFIKPYDLTKDELIDFRLKVYKELNMDKQLSALKVSS